MSSVCWGLKDTIIFFACGSKLLSVDIVKDEVPSLKRLSREYLTSNCTPDTLQRLPLPNKEITVLKRMTSSLIPVCYTCVHMKEGVAGFERRCGWVEGGCGWVI